APPPAWWPAAPPRQGSRRAGRDPCPGTRRGPPAPTLTMRRRWTAQFSPGGLPLRAAVDAAGRAGGGGRRRRPSACRRRLRVGGSRRRDRVPLATEEVLALPRDLARGVVELEEVERMALVRDLRLAV